MKILLCSTWGWVLFVTKLPNPRGGMVLEGDVKVDFGEGSGLLGNSAITK